MTKAIVISLYASLQKMKEIIERDQEHRRRIKQFNKHHNNKKLHEFFPVK